ncbi:MAG: NAD(P)H-hydrate dehydratase [Gammaproteobacteria bacterium]
MSPLPTSLYQAAQVRELDRIAIEEYGIASIDLMERAGQAAWALFQTAWPNTKRLAVICAGGNNAGDGYILARLALASGYTVQVLTLTDPARLQGDAKTAAARLIESGAVCEVFSEGCLTDRDVIVDAILGTGLDRKVSGDYAGAIEAINRSGKAVFSIDIPSGLHADTGRIMGTAVKADITLTFIGLKQGLFTGQGAECCGKVLFSDLDVPGDIYLAVSRSAQRIDADYIDRLLARRSRTGHKGDYGHVLIIGGDYGFAGAALMAGKAAARVGAGLVSVATRPQHAAAIPLAMPEVMSHGVTAAVDLNPLLERATVIAIGPGLGQHAWGMALLARVLESKLPIVADADALNLIARDPSRSEQWILTPHPGEAARLLGSSSAEVQADRFKSARALQKKFGGVIVLKGSGTVIADDEGALSVCSAGNPGMATGGMGDVLTGVIAGFLAQGFQAGEAARLGVCVHAAAADKVAAEGERGMLATDLMPWLRRLANP